MATLIERVAKATKKRAEAEQEFRSALVAARPTHSWNELAGVTGMSINGVRYLVLEHTKGESDGDSGGATDSEQPGRDARASRGSGRTQGRPQGSEA